MGTMEIKRSEWHGNIRKVLQWTQSDYQRLVLMNQAGFIHNPGNDQDDGSDKGGDNIRREKTERDDMFAW